MKRGAKLMAIFFIFIGVAPELARACGPVRAQAQEPRLYYTLSRKKKKKKSNIIIGALGSTWDHDFCMGTQNRMRIEK